MGLRGRPWPWCFAGPAVAGALVGLAAGPAEDRLAAAVGLRGAQNRGGYQAGMTQLPTPRGALTPDRPLADLTWLRVGGPADWLFQPADEADLAAFLAALDPAVAVFPMGVGSNLIVRDGGIRAVVIRLGRGFNGISIEGDRVIARGGGAGRACGEAGGRGGAGPDLPAHHPGQHRRGGADECGLLRVLCRGCAGGGPDRHAAGRVETLPAAAPEPALPAKRPARGRGDRVGHASAPHRAIRRRWRRGWPTRSPSGMPASRRRIDLRARPSAIPWGGSSTGTADDTHELKAWKVIDDAGMRGARIGGAQMSHDAFQLPDQRRRGNCRRSGKSGRGSAKKGLPIKRYHVRVGNHAGRRIPAGLTISRGT